MKLRSCFRLLCVLAPSVLSGFAQMQSAVVDVEGAVDICYHPKDTPRRLPRGATTLWGGSTLIGTPEGGHVNIYWKDKARTSRALKAPDTIPIPVTSNPSYAVLERQVGEMMGRAGAPRSSTAVLHSPANGARLLPDRPVSLRWQPTIPGRKFIVEVTNDAGERVWRGSFAGETGQSSPDEGLALSAALREAAGRGARRFFFNRQLDGGEPADEAVQCALLPADRIAQLDQQLALCDTATDTNRDILRAAVYRSFGVTDAALEALDRALLDRDLGRQPELIHVVARLHEAAGDHARAAVLKERLQTLSPLPVP